MKKKIDLLIFDLDGTLIDSQRDIIVSVQEMLKGLGLPEKSYDTVKSYIGLGIDRLIMGALGEENSAKLNEGMGIFEDYYGKHMFDTTALYLGVKETLEHFKDKKMAVITNKQRRTTLAALRRFRIAKYFSEVLGGDDVICRKPDACPIDKVLAKLKVTRGRAVIIGDSEFDILAGKNSGIVTCAVTYGIGRRENISAARPDYIIDDIRRLKDIIE